MKILILGRGKSGTTALLFKVAAGLPDCKAFSGGHPGKYAGEFENAVYKHTYSERKGKTFDVYHKHISEENYDRKIWMARDPRDIAVSRMLFRWHKGPKGSWKQYRTHLELVQKKELDPKSVPFHVLCRYIGHGNWPLTTEEVVEDERLRYERMGDFVNRLQDDWFIFKYEDMIDGNLDRLNDYLGFTVKNDAEVPASTGKAKVARKKAYGDWRNWFTEEDTEVFKTAYLPYLEAIGYDCNDWAVSRHPVIEPEYASMYMQRLVRANMSNPFTRVFREKILPKIFP
ncbi:MAG: sulfotransferase domain-containing protein [Deltaproteobacteria bacterium]